MCWLFHLAHRCARSVLYVPNLALGLVRPTSIHCTIRTSFLGFCLGLANENRVGSGKGEMWVLLPYFFPLCVGAISGDNHKLPCLRLAGDSSALVTILCELHLYLALFLQAIMAQIWLFLVSGHLIFSFSFSFF